MMLSYLEGPWDKDVFLDGSTRAILQVCSAFSPTAFPSISSQVAVAGEVLDL